MGSYVDSQLLPGEEVKHVAHVHWAVYVPAIFFAIMWLVFARVSVSSTTDTLDAFAAISGLSFILLVYNLIKAFIRRRTTELAITNKRVIAKFGLIRRTTFEQQLTKVEGVNLVQSITGRILGYASINVRGTGEGLTPIHLIGKPDEFKKQLATQLQG